MSLGIQRLVHPTDFSAGSGAAFAHALRIALVARCRLDLLHIRGEEGAHWQDFPHVRATLESWGVAGPGWRREDVGARLGLSVSKFDIPEDSPLEGITRFLNAHPSELIVLASHRRDGLARWLQPSVAEAVSRHAGTHALFVNPDGRGFVEPVSGNVSLRRILVPVDHQPSANDVIGRVAAFAQAMAGDGVVIDLLHVGDDPPRITAAAHQARLSPMIHGRGPVVDAIEDTAVGRQADLIAMPTAGHNGLLDALRGSTTEQVVRRARCPVLAFPA